MENRLIVSASPHLRHSDNTPKIMLDVIIALLPASLFGVYHFGMRASLVILVTIIASLLAEFVTRKILKRPNTIGDLSAVVTGLLLALNLPPNIPLWIAAVGGAIAIILVKQIFGGLGQNFMNPALAARVILMISWPVQMTNWKNPKLPDVIASATPLAQIKNGAEALSSVSLPSYVDLFFGNVGGCIGEVSAAALLLGAAYLLYKKVISLELPLVFIGTLGVFTWIFGGNGLSGSTFFSGDPIYQILSGGLIIGAFFMATDYTTSPITRKGKIIMGFGCGLLAAVIRLYTNYPEGVSFAIILMNIIVPLIDRYTIPVSFGGEIVHE